MGIEMGGVQISWTALGEVSGRKMQEHEDFFPKVGLKRVTINRDIFFDPFFDLEQGLWYFPEQVRGFMNFSMKISTLRQEASSMAVLDFQGKAIDPSTTRLTAVDSKEVFITSDNELIILVYHFEKQYQKGRFVLGRFFMERLPKKRGVKINKEVTWKANDDCGSFLCLSCGMTFPEKPYAPHKIPGTGSFCSSIPVRDVVLPENLGHLKMEMFKMRKKAKRT